jgi:hypothetical protein
MATEGVENFQAILVSLAAVAGSAIAGMGLWTWKQQIRWQQGRGLAVNTLQAFFAFKRISMDVTKHRFSRAGDDASADELLALFNTQWASAKEYCDRLEDSHINLEKHIAEAIIVWGDDFRSFLNEIADVAHIARSNILTGAASFDPRRSLSDRIQSSALYQAFNDDVHGANEDRISLGDRLARAQKGLETILLSKRLT